MPGYGRSTARKVIEDYAQQEINTAMLELLNHVKRERAVWIGEHHKSHAGFRQNADLAKVMTGVHRLCG
jgi:hypothetical protein